MRDDIDRGRSDLARWLDDSPRDWLSVHPGLLEHLAARAGHPLDPAWVHELSAFGRTVSSEVDPAVALAESRRDLPRHVPFDGVGRRVERIEFHPAQVEAARLTWASGLLDTERDLDGDLRLAGAFFLLTHVGEGGLACPVVCTVGLRRALERRADAELRQRFVGPLRSRDAEHAFRGAQFLTEVHGGSDVGANATRATPDPDEEGVWRLDGEKWFCSVADADLFAVTARPEGAPEGTRGLGCFVVPRTLDGATPNGFAIRRLKDKLGTRTLASAEIDFDGAVAYPIGAVTEGFSVAVEELLNVSRWLNAIGSAGIMGRAWLVATTFAQSRRAFGHTIDHFDPVREQLALLRVETDAALASTLALTGLVGALDAGTATDDETDAHRFLVNALKFVTSRTATACAHDAIEVLGGNGTIEDFSVLPRLYRDSMVFESWEGTHHVLCAQIERDCHRLDVASGLSRWLDGELDLIPDAASDLAVPVRRAAQEALARLRRGRVEDLGVADVRRCIERVTRITQSIAMLRAANDERARASAALFVACHLSQDDRSSQSWSQLVDEVVRSSAP